MRDVPEKPFVCPNRECHRQFTADAHTIANTQALLRGMAQALEQDIAGERKVSPYGMLQAIRKIQSIYTSETPRITPDATDVKDKFGGAAYAWPTGAATPPHAAEQLIPNGETRTLALGGQHALIQGAECHHVPVESASAIESKEALFAAAFVHACDDENSYFGREDDYHAAKALLNAGPVPNGNMEPSERTRADRYAGPAPASDPSSIAPRHEIEWVIRSCLDENLMQLGAHKAKVEKIKEWLKNATPQKPHSTDVRCKCGTTTDTRKFWRCTRCGTAIAAP